jgi:hypothetical protein
VQLAVGVGLDDIDPGERRCLAGHAERPVEPGDVTVGVDGARALHDMPRHLGLHGGDHAVVGLEAVGLQHRVAVPEVGPERLLDERSPLRSVGLVPGLQVGVDDGLEGGGRSGVVAHGDHDERAPAPDR